MKVQTFIERKLRITLDIEDVVVLEDILNNVDESLLEKYKAGKNMVEYLLGCIKDFLKDT